MAGGAQLIEPTPSGDCQDESFAFTNRVTCNPTDVAELYLGAGDDLVEFTLPLPVGDADEGAYGQGGNDTFTVHDGAGTPGARFYYLSGDTGDDTFTSEARTGDWLYGDDGEDWFTTVIGPDQVNGGAGIDKVSFGGVTDPITVTLDNGANDGVTSQAANVRADVENVDGGPAADSLTGDADPNTLRGFQGGDAIVSAAGQDVIEAGDGNDTIDARDGEVDQVDCGPDADIVFADVADVLASCEEVRLPDADGDGSPVNLDCDDGNAAIHPGATDVPGDGIDQDCLGGDAPPALGGAVDADGDGVSPPTDCRDDDAAIRPGAVDTPGDAIDQDCQGGPAPFPVLDPPVRNRWAVGNRRTRVVQLVVRTLPATATVEVRCRGPRCPFKKRKVAPRDGTARLTKLFKDRALPAGTVIELRALAPGMVGKVVRYRLRTRQRLPRSTRLCLPPGAASPAACG